MFHRRPRGFDPPAGSQLPVVARQRPWPRKAVVPTRILNANVAHAS